MRLRTLAVATATALVVTIAPTTAAHAAKPAYKVSISVSKTTADVGQTIRVSGKVAGAKSARKKIAIQRKVGSGAWRTVKKVRTTKKSRYSTTVTVTTAGAQQFRVVAPKSSVRRAGTSTARRLTGWRWVDPTATAVIEDLTKSTVTIDGKKYANVLTAAPSSSTPGALYVQTNGACDAFTVSVGSEGTVDSQAVFYLATVLNFTADDPLSHGQKAVSGGQAPVSSRWAIKPTANLVAFGLQSYSDAGTERAAAIAPRLHCKVNALPKTTVAPTA